MDLESAYIQDSIPEILNGFENLDIRDGGIVINQAYRYSTNIIIDRLFNDVKDNISDTITDAVLNNNVESFKKIESKEELDKDNKIVAFCPDNKWGKSKGFLNCHHIFTPYLYERFHQVKKYSWWDKLCRKHKKRLVFFAPQESCHIIFSKIQVKNNSSHEGVDVELVCSLSATIENISYMELR